MPSGKSTVATYLSASRHLNCIDMDSRIYGSYLQLYSRERHPATRTWFDQDNQLQWALSLSWEEFEQLNQATTAEILDLFAQETPPRGNKSVLVDGGISHPALLAQVVDPARIICLRRPQKACSRSWEEDENRAQMKQIILSLADGQQAWKKFLHFDTMLSRTIAEQCTRSAITILDIEEDESIAVTAQRVAAHFSL